MTLRSSPKANSKKFTGISKDTSRADAEDRGLVPVARAHGSRRDAASCDPWSDLGVCSLERLAWGISYTYAVP